MSAVIQLRAPQQAHLPPTPSPTRVSNGRRNNAMFLRMLWRAAWVKRGRAALALGAVAVAAALATVLLSLYGNSQARLQAEFRSFGANVVVAPANGAALAHNAAEQAQNVLGASADVVPYAYVIARTANGPGGAPVVVAGVDLARARKLNTWWQVSAWPAAAASPGPVPALFGARAYTGMNANAGPVRLWFHDAQIVVSAAGTLQAGGDEDSRIYLPMDAFYRWSGTEPSLIEVRVPGSKAEINAAIAGLQRALPKAEVRPIRQVTDAEARVLGRTRALLIATTLAVLGTSALCLLATLISWVSERRRDFAVMKALGASERLLVGFFVSEAGLLGACGGAAGFILGLFAAAFMGRAALGAAPAPDFALLPGIVLGGLLLGAIAALGPVGHLRRIQPAAILRGE